MIQYMTPKEKKRMQRERALWWVIKVCGIFSACYYFQKISRAPIEAEVGLLVAVALAWESRPWA